MRVEVGADTRARVDRRGLRDRRLQVLLVVTSPLAVEDRDERRLLARSRTSSPPSGSSRTRSSPESRTTRTSDSRPAPSRRPRMRSAAPRGRRTGRAAGGGRGGQGGRARPKVLPVEAWAVDRCVVVRLAAPASSVCSDRLRPERGSEERPDRDRCIEHERCQRAKRRRASGRHRSTAGLRSAALSTSTKHRQAREESAVTPLQPRLQDVAVTVERPRSARRGSRKSRNASAKPWLPPASESRARRHEQGREQAAGHPDQASPSPRTFLYAPRRLVPRRRRPMAAASLTWLGHASFRLDSPAENESTSIPWLDNPSSAPTREKDPERCDAIAVTHGHRRSCRRDDRSSRRSSARCRSSAMIELKGWLTGDTARRRTTFPARTRAARSRSQASSSRSTNALPLELPPTTALRSARRPGSWSSSRTARRSTSRGDTCVFGDMQLDRAHLRPGRRRAADRRALHDGSTRGRGRLRASRRAKRVVPCHYGTFPTPGRNA